MPSALIRYGLLRQLAELPPDDDALLMRGPCVVRTPRGLELGDALAVLDGPGDAAAGAVVREAEPADLERARDQAAAVADCDLPRLRDLGRKAGLKAIGAERLLGGAAAGERLVAYYTADGRVDVPAFLREAEAALEVEVRLEQLGARGRARLCGGAGVCGRTLCCSTFLRRMEPVTMRMARVQGRALAPEVTAGACGRLKCCLRYENPLYEEHTKGLPRKGWRVVSRRVEGTALRVDVLRRRVLVRPDDGGAPLALFADEIERSGPAPRAPLPLAGAEPVDAEAEGDDDDEVDRGWSTLARRLWRRVTPRPPKPPDEAD